MTDKERVPPEAVGLLIQQTSPSNLVKLARKLWAFQTLDEQAALMTKYNNGVGYNSADAASVGMTLRHAERGVLSEDEAVDLRKRLFKYRRQLADILSPVVMEDVDVEAVAEKMVLEVTLFAKRVEHQTSRAVKFRFRQNGTEREFDCWFPKKQVEWVRNEETGLFEVYVPLWMAQSKDLVNSENKIIVGPGEQVSWGRNPPDDTFKRSDEAEIKAKRMLERIKRQKQEQMFEE